MPIIKSAIKKVRQDKKRYAKNLRVKRDLRDAIKTFETKPTFEALRKLQSQIDTAVKKNILEKNTAARRMKKFSKLAKESGVKIPTAVVKKSTTPKTTKKAKSSATKTVAKKPIAKKPVRSKTAKKS